MLGGKDLRRLIEDIERTCMCLRVRAYTGREGRER